MVVSRGFGYALLHIAVLRTMIEGRAFCPQEATRLRLPSDYPAHVPFYQSISDSGVRFSLREEGLGRFWINENSGELSLSAPLGPPQDSPKRAFLVQIQARPSDGSAPCFMNISIDIISSIKDFCSPSRHLCFANSGVVRYKLPESLPTGVVFDQLQQRIILANVCSDFSTTYQVTKGHEDVAVDEGGLSLLRPVDAESVSRVNIQISCALTTPGNDTSEYLLEGFIEVEDVDDNPPFLQAGSNSIRDIDVSEIQPGRPLESLQMNVMDRDSKKVNNMDYRIEGDALKLFKIAEITTFQVEEGKMLINTVIKATRSVIFPGAQYNFSVVVTDKSYKGTSSNQVVFHIRVNNKTAMMSTPTIPPVYIFNETSLSRTATLHTRVYQPLMVEEEAHFWFVLSNDAKIFQVTPRTGIVYVSDEQGLRVAKENFFTINVSWNSVHFQGVAVVVVNLTDDGVAEEDQKCEDLCAAWNNEEECVSSCGRGAVKGRCQWRAPKNRLPTDKLTSEYTTCTSDLITCPDNVCDELEKLDKGLCPQDCAKSVFGECIPHPNERGGIQLAKGPCVCSEDSCTCLSDLPSNRTSEMESRDQVSNLERSSGNHSYKKFNMAPYTDTPTTLNSESENDSRISSNDVYFVSGLTSTTACGQGCVAFIFLAISFSVIIAFIVVFLRRLQRQKKRQNKHKYVGSRMSLSAVPSDYVDDRSSSVHEAFSETSISSKNLGDAKFEFPRDHLILEETLGEGEFGKVMKAHAWNIHGTQGYTTVAVKMLKGNGTIAEQQDLLSEFQMLKEVSHPNVVKLLGACTQKGGPLYVIVEYAENGSLKNYLRKTRHLDYDPPLLHCVDNPSYVPHSCNSWQQPKQIISQRDLMSFAWQIAKGMSYLSDMKLVHRDLAARNILVAKGKLLKISDFGLSRDVYEGDTYLKKSKSRVPVKWMAIESLEDHIYTTRSDVWSFGVVLWEIVTLGATPYPGVTPERLFHLLKAGYRMEKPENCSDEQYQLMTSCWREIPHDRPSFKELVQKYDCMLQETSSYLDLSPATLDDTATTHRFFPDVDKQDDNSTMEYGSILRNSVTEDTLPKSPLDQPEQISLLPLTRLSRSDLGLPPHRDAAIA